MYIQSEIPNAKNIAPVIDFHSPVGALISANV